MVDTKFKESAELLMNDRRARLAAKLDLLSLYTKRDPETRDSSLEDLATHDFSRGKSATDTMSKETALYFKELMPIVEKDRSSDLQKRRFDFEAARVQLVQNILTRDSNDASLQEISNGSSSLASSIFGANADSQVEALDHEVAAHNLLNELQSRMSACGHGLSDEKREKLLSAFVTTSDDYLPGSNPSSVLATALSQNTLHPDERTLEKMKGILTPDELSEFQEVLLYNDSCEEMQQMDNDANREAPTAPLVGNNNG